MYPSDLSDEGWALIAHHFEPKDRRGSACLHAKKDIVNAILYVVKGGIPWRMLPANFPPWKTVYDHFRNWNRWGVWESALADINRLYRKKRQK
jgi:Transposase and inactivated derivatives